MSEQKENENQKLSIENERLKAMLNDKLMGNDT